VPHSTNGMLFAVRSFLQTLSTFVLPRHASTHVPDQTTSLNVAMAKRQLRCTQADTFDRLHMPWTYDPDVGPIVASPVAGRGDGAFMYASIPDLERSLRVVPNPTPKTEAEFAEMRKQNLQRLLQSMAARGDFRHHATDSDSEHECVATSQSEVLITDNGHRIAQTSESSLRNKRVRTCDERTTSSRASMSDQDARLAAGGFTIHEKPRPNGGRVDLCIIAANGRKFRSKSSALAYFDELNANEDESTDA